MIIKNHEATNFLDSILNLHDDGQAEVDAH